MIRALAFFGAFNPPTVAHVGLADAARRKTGRDCVVFVPSQSVYIREEQGKDFAYSEQERLRMLREAAESRPWMRVTDWELKQERQPRTYETLRHLREEGYDPALLLGSDKLPELEHGWRHVAEICREFGIVCLTRGRDECGKMIREDPYLAGLAPWIEVLETPEETKEISSTEVRKRVAQIRELQREIRAMVPPEIVPLLNL